MPLIVSLLVVVAMGYELDGRGSNLGRGKSFSLFHSVQTDTGAQSASSSMGRGGSFSGE
jgi:hypothetical protein